MARKVSIIVMVILVISEIVLFAITDNADFTNNKLSILILITLVLGMTITIILPPGKTNFPPPKLDKNSPKSEKKDYIGYWVAFVVYGVFIGYILLEFYFGGSSLDCFYSNTGCYGDHNRWGQ